MIKAILFDLDGVLVDSCDWHFKALNQALIEQYYAPISYEDHVKYYDGLPTRIKLNRLGIPEEDRLIIENQKQDHTKALIERGCVYDTDLVETISRLRNEGFRTGCVTNCTAATTNSMLERLGVLSLLDTVVTNQYGGPPKPSPDPYLHALKHLEISPEECLIVEDSPKGLQAAAAAECLVMMVRSRADVTYEKIKDRLCSVTL